MRAPVLLLLSALSACGPAGGGMATTEPAQAARYVVVVSFDGMRHDMPDRVETPSFDRLAREGVRAAGLIPSYPSKTFPNHYTLATGLYPSNHGIVDNAFYDPRLGETYRLGDTATVRDGRWYGGEPIWVTAETQGVPAASFFWVGTEAEIAGVRPSYYKYYDGSVPYEARVDTVLQWLALPLDRRPRLVMLYFSEPDYTAHTEGPDAAPVDSVVRRMDGLLGRLLDGLDDLPIADRIDVVVVSDHGMADAPGDQVLFLDDYVDLQGVRVVDNSTQALLYFDGDESRMWSVYEALGERLEHARPYLAEETPERWHYRGTPRIGDVVVAAEPGWILRTRERRPWRGGGAHGWDPHHPGMQGIFLAAGPGIRESGTIPAFENIHVYPLIAALLGLEPAPDIDGRREAIESILADPAPASAGR